jgi:hypothetical protein
VGSAKFEYFSMSLPNQTVKTRRPIMLNIKTSGSYDLKPVELTSAELDSVAGGNSALAAASMALSHRMLLENATPAVRQNGR